MSHTTKTKPDESSRSSYAAHGSQHSIQPTPGSAGKKPQGPDKRFALLTATGTNGASASRLNAVNSIPAPPQLPPPTFSWKYDQSIIVAAADAKSQSAAAAENDAAIYASLSPNSIMRRKRVARFLEGRLNIHRAAGINIHARLLCLLRVARLVIRDRLAREKSFYDGKNFKMFRQKLREIAAHVRGVVLADKAARESQRQVEQAKREDAQSRCPLANPWLRNCNVGGSKDYGCNCGFCHSS